MHTCGDLHIHLHTCPLTYQSDIAHASSYVQTYYIPSLKGPQVSEPHGKALVTGCILPGLAPELGPSAAFPGS